MTVKCLIRVFAVSVGCWVLSVGAAADDVFVSYVTQGPDCYADGTTVRDGECYALVCTKKGEAFRGFTAAGTVISPETDDVAVIAPAALNGHCRRVVFGLPKAYVNQHKSDVWSVQLLDTRTAEGRPAGLVNGLPARINGYGQVDGTVGFDNAMVSFGQGKGSARAALASALPPELVPQPVITGITVKEGRVLLTVDDTVPFVTYDLAGAETPNGLHGSARRVARGKRDGVAGRAITLEADAHAQVKFFKVVRAE